MVLLGLGVTLSAVGFAGSPVGEGSATLARRLNGPRPLVVAHRGCVDFAPENSLAALEACIALRIDMAEGDIRATKDGVLVLLHDANLDRTTDMTGLLDERTYSEVKGARV